MSQQSIERLKAYLEKLPPRSQARLTRQFELAIERGEETAFAALVLEQLRKVVRGTEERSPPPRKFWAARLLFQPLDPFLINGHTPLRPGRVRRSSLLPIWQWLAREGAPDAIQAFEQIRLDTGADPPEAAVHELQLVVADAIFRILSRSDDDSQRGLARIGGNEIIQDLLPIASVLHSREALETLATRLPISIRPFEGHRVGSIYDTLSEPELLAPQVMPFALSVLVQRLSAPWQIVRVAIRAAGSDVETRVAATPFGVAITIALHDLFCLAVSLRTDIKHGQFAGVPDKLKALHDSVRGMRTELDLRHDSAWGRQLAAIRAEISNTLRSDIEVVPGRVRRILRPCTDREVLNGAEFDGADADGTAALVDFVALCRTYAGELAINEVTLRTFSDLQQYVEKTTEALVQSLRTGDIRTRLYRELQANAAMRFCEALFGRDYAMLIGRAVDNAVASEPKSARAG